MQNGREIEARDVERWVEKYGRRARRLREGLWRAIAFEQERSLFVRLEVGARVKLEANFQLCGQSRIGLVPPYWIAGQNSLLSHVCYIEEILINQIFSCNSDINITK